MQDLVSKLREGKERMAARCMAAAKKWTPPGYVVRYRKDLTGMHFGGNVKMIHAPKPITRKSLYTYLHECAHAHLGHYHNGKQPRHREEYEAEKWAIARMKEERIAVPRSMVKRGKGYVAWKIKQALKRGAKLSTIDGEAIRFSGTTRKELKAWLEHWKGCRITG